jgi:DNA-binding transcriptional MocR family regulator
LILQTNLPPGMIDLGLGNPDPSLFPFDLLGQSAQAELARRDPRPLQYGLEQGDGYFRAALADFLAQAYRTPVHPGRLFISAGASSALDLLCTLYTQPGDTIFVEEPSYFLALRIFADHGLRPVSIAMDAHGLNLDDLDEKLASHRPRLLYSVPVFQNPSGRRLSAERRAGLVERAARHNFLLVADEVYHCLDHGTPPPPPLAAWAEESQQVVSIGSFSKILAPGVRLGWVQAHAAVIKRLALCGLLDSGGGLNPFMSALVRELVESGGLAQHAARLRAEYAARAAALTQALMRHLPAAQFEPPQGGFFAWARLPGVDTAALRPVAQAHGVDIRPGRLFSSQGGLGEYMRLCFAHYPPQEIEAGVRRLAACL